MIKIENVVLPSEKQWLAVILGTRNPKNSWDRSDSLQGCSGRCYLYEDIPGVDTEDCSTCPENICIGQNDLKLMTQLAKGGPVHAKYRRMIPVYLDITAPLYWWKEFDTYKVGTVTNSCSTMHKIHAKEFVLDDFSHEHLFDDYSIEPELTYCENDEGNNYVLTSKECLRVICELLNHHRFMYLETKDKRYWHQMIQLLPSSYNQKRTVMLNYEVLVGIYEHRRNHKLKEWRDFTEWIETLPYSELITGGKDENRN